MSDAYFYEKMAKNPIEDCQCPICLDILIEPVTMPCKHELCLQCFEKHIAETSLTCPVCRLRISVWSRKAHREKTLVNMERWKQIQRQFSAFVKKRLRSSARAWRMAHYRSSTTNEFGWLNEIHCLFYCKAQGAVPLIWRSIATTAFFHFTWEMYLSLTSCIVK